MEKNYFTLPVVKIIDEWENELEGFSIVYQIKLTSGDHQPDWYSVSCWQKGVSNCSIGSVFIEKLDREFVEAYFRQIIFDCLLIGVTR